MEIGKEKLELLQKILRDDYGASISLTEARELSFSLVHLFENIYQKPPKGFINDFVFKKGGLKI